MKYIKDLRQRAFFISSYYKEISGGKKTNQNIICRLDIHFQVSGVDFEIIIKKF